MGRRLLMLVIASAALCAAAFGPAGAAAQQGPRVERPAEGERRDGARSRRAAERALERARALRDGRRRASARELTLALKELAVTAPALEGEAQREARRLLSRPTDGLLDPQGDGYATGEAAGSPYCPAGSIFCVHWVSTTADAPDLTDADGDSVPDYVEQVALELETSRAVENGNLGWRLPVSDGTRGTGQDRTDVYIAQVGNEGLYGYAAADDPGQTADDPTRYAYLVLDDDYADPAFAGTPPLDSLRATVAHEYNHVLQFAYDVFQDAWQAEATATWMEDQVYDSVDDYLNYVDDWATLTEVPLTEPPSEVNLKPYGDAVWNHWLAERYTAAVVRGAQETSVASGSFAPLAYENAIRATGGQSFVDEFNRFSAATAEWQTPGSGFSEGPSYPNVERLPGTLTPDGGQATGQLDHTTFALRGVAPSTAPAITLTGSLPSGTTGAVALVGRTAAGALTTRLTPLPAGGSGSVTLEEPGTYARITAVIVNADTSRSGFSPVTQDWVWTRDDQPYSVRVTTGATSPPTPPVTPPPATGGTAPGSTQAAPPTSGSEAPPPPAADTARPNLTLSASRRQRASEVARRGLAVTLRSSDPDALRYALEAGASSRALRARGAVVVGRRSGTLPRGATARVRIRLSRAALRALRARGRLRVSVSAALQDPQGNSARLVRTIVISR